MPDRPGGNCAREPDDVVDGGVARDDQGGLGSDQVGDDVIPYVLTRDIEREALRARPIEIVQATDRRGLRLFKDVELSGLSCQSSFLPSHHSSGLGHASGCAQRHTLPETTVGPGSSDEPAVGFSGTRRRRRGRLARGCHSEGGRYLDLIY